MYHQHQYTEAEYGDLKDKHVREQADKARKNPSHSPEPFAGKGGAGYDPNRSPNADCPECWGRGKGMPLFHDTRGLQDGEALVYAGIRVSADGNVEIKTHSPFEALQLIGRHLGMWNDKVKVTTAENPLMALIQEIQEAHSTLPIVHDDPELRRPGAPPAVQDVAAKPNERATIGSPAMKKGSEVPRTRTSWRPVK